MYCHCRAHTRPCISCLVQIHDASAVYVCVCARASGAWHTLTHTQTTVQAHYALDTIQSWRVLRGCQMFSAPVQLFIPSNIHPRSSGHSAAWNTSNPLHSAPKRSGSHPLPRWRGWRHRESANTRLVSKEDVRAWLVGSATGSLF